MDSPLVTVNVVARRDDYVIHVQVKENYPYSAILVETRTEGGAKHVDVIYTKDQIGLWTRVFRNTSKRWRVEVDLMGFSRKLVSEYMIRPVDLVVDAPRLVADDGPGNTWFFPISPLAVIPVPVQTTFAIKRANDELPDLYSAFLSRHPNHKSLIGYMVTFPIPPMNGSWTAALHGGNLEAAVWTGSTYCREFDEADEQASDDQLFAGYGVDVASIWDESPPWLYGSESLI